MSIYLHPEYFSCTAKAFVTYVAESDDHVIIYNANDNEEAQLEGIRHELQHIIRDDPTSEREAIEIEKEIIKEGY